MSLSTITATFTLSATAFTSALDGASLHVLAFQIGEVESGNNAAAVGDGGRALGLLQIHRCVVKDVNRHYKTAYQHRDALNPTMAYAVFIFYMHLYATPERLGRPVTNRDRALIWHMGPNGWKKADTDAAKRYLAKFPL